MVTPQKNGLYPGLIPKNITIVRCYYDQEIVAPGTIFGFDINGSGFTESFNDMIAIDFDALDVQAINMRLVTANQIHGQVQVGSEATTQYIYPTILIRNLPVFKAEDAFGVVRPREVLDMQLIQIDETGQSGRFQVITNLDAATYKRFKVDPTSPHLQLSSLYPKLPFYVQGDLTIAPGLRNGQYGLTASMAGHEIFRKDPLVDVVHPNVGRAGTVERVTATDAVHRPGDELQLTLTGSGFSPSDTTALSARIDGITTDPAQFTFATAGKLQIALRLPPNLPVGVYGISIFQKQKQVYTKKTVFAIVPVNWIGGIKLPRPLAPGQSGTVQITGRELSPAYVQSLQATTDEPGLKLSPLRLQDASTIVADLVVSTATAPGDYIIHISSGDQPVRMPTGDIIKIGG